MKLSGNTIFIAGATSGIGRGLAERFADAGNNVIIAGRRQHLVDEIVAGHDNIGGLVLDVNDPLSIEAAVSTIKTTFPETNVLVTVAGIMMSEDLHTDSFLPTAEATDEHEPRWADATDRRADGVSGVQGSRGDSHRLVGTRVRTPCPSRRPTARPRLRSTRSPSRFGYSSRTPPFR
jgi:NAD(P)-dependent dehydrogenase (short-subunit alcohol dehydrogenase family)